MSTETTAWLIAIVAGIASGVIAGLQPRVTPDAVIAITGVLVFAAVLVSRLLPSEADRVP